MIIINRLIHKKGDGDLKYNKLFVVVLCLLSLLSFCVYAENEICLAPGETTMVKIDTGKPSYLYFIPKVDGEYAITSLSDCDTLCALYDENMKELMSDDDSGDTSNFYISYNFKAGRKYVLSVWYYGDKINYDMPVLLKLISAVESHKHTYTVEVISSPSCNAEGKSRYSCICGDVYFETYKKLNHSFITEIIKEPDCVNKGKGKDICVLCGLSNEIYLDALGHSFSDKLTVDVSATCTSTGYASRHCERCDKTTDKTVIEKLDHCISDEYIITKMPTCTSKGLKIRSCIFCNKVLEELPGDKTEHKYDLEYEIIKHATCTSKGEKVRRCIDCNKMLETVSIDKTEHIPSDNYVITKKATCTSYGEKIKKCISCDKTLETVQIERISHTASTDYETVKSPTCTSVGEKVRRCTVCNKVLENVSVDKVNHTADENFEIIKAPTCTANGERVKRCTQCNKALITEVISKTGHFLPEEYTVIKNATCTAKGEKVKYCTVCKAISERTDIDKTGHSYSDKYTVDIASTLTESGKKSRHCKSCNSKTDVISIPRIKTVVLEKDSFIYNGKYKTIKVVVKNSKGKKLKKGRDYTVSYKKNKAIGEYKVTVIFKGDYSGKKSLYYKIFPQDASVLDIKQKENSVKLTLKKLKGNVKYRIYKRIKNGKYRLLKETDKPVVVINNLKTGTEYTISVKSVKKVKGKLYKSKNICRVKVSTYPLTTVLTASSTKRGNVTLIWNEVNCDGYEIYKYNSSSAEYEIFKRITKGDITSYVRNNVRRGELCKFKIRAYKQNGKEILFSPYSDVISVRVKY